MKKINYLIILMAIFAVIGCNVNDPVEGLSLKFNVDVDETIVKPADIPQGSQSPRTPIQLFKNAIISPNTLAGSVPLYKSKPGRIISQRVFFRNELVAINGKITNNSDSEVLIGFYLEENKNVITMSKMLAKFKIPPKSSVEKFTLQAISNFEGNKDYYFCIYANGDNLNVTVSNFSLIPCSDIISSAIKPPKDDYQVEQILSSDFSGTIKNNGKAPVTIQIFISDYSYSNLEKDKIAEITINKGVTKFISKKDLELFNNELLNSLIKTYVNDRKKLYCRTVFNSLSELNLEVDEIKVKGKVEVGDQI